jgi:hypothetical protein
MINRWPVQNWHDMIGDHTFGHTILDRLGYHTHRIPLQAARHAASGLVNLRPTTPHRSRHYPGNRHQSEGLNAKYPFDRHIRCPIMGREATA